MAATPQYASFTFIGLQSKKTYTVDAYLSDVANALVRFDGGSGSSSSSPDDWALPEDCALVDYSQVTGTQDTTKLQLLRNNAATGDILRYVPHVSTNAMRPRLNIGFRAGTRFRALQLA